MPKRVKKQPRQVAEHTLKPNAAGIDIGAYEIYVAVGADRDKESVRSFQTFTANLKGTYNTIELRPPDYVRLKSHPRNLGKRFQSLCCENRLSQ